MPVRAVAVTGASPEAMDGRGELMTSGPVDKLEALLRLLPDAFLVLGSAGDVLDYLGGGADDPVLDPANMPGRAVSDLLPKETAALVVQHARRALKTRRLSTIEFQLGERGVQQSYEMRLVAMSRDRVLGVVRNLSQGPSSAGAGNAFGSSFEYDEFLSRLEAVICDAALRERGLVLLSIGLEQVTRIRRHLGKAVADAVLQVAGTRIESCLRGGDQLARTAPDSGAQTQFARLGADEFVIILRDVEDRDAARSISARVREAFAEPVTFDEHSFEMSPHIGIALYPLDGESAEEILKNARTALDEARVRGGNGLEFYTSTTRYRVRRRLDVGKELAWAIDDGQLELRWLPRIDLGNGCIAGLEALLRWNHPLRGLVALNELIPLAETTGLMLPIGEWVLETACAQAAEWRSTWKEMPPVSVNLSPQEIAREDLADVVGQALAASGLPPVGLELEITEAELMREEKSAAVLRRLDKLGVGLVIDDFGRGYSSLNRMTELPIKAIKIDRPIVEACRESDARGAVCAAIIAMASRLGLTVIAEGVETVEQINFLRDQGCDALQGFFFTEPLVRDDVPGFLAAHLGATPDGEPVDLPTIRSRFALTSAD